MNTQITPWIAVFLLPLASLFAVEVTMAQSSEPVAIEAATAEVFQAVRQFYEYNPDAPLQADVIAEEEFDSYTREKIVFTGVQHSRVPGYLAVPTSGAGPFPVVILMDGITGSKDRWFEEDSWPRGSLVTNALIDEGIAVLSMDARYHGERASENDYRMPSHWSEQRDMIAQSVVEQRRGMDYLMTRTEIDTTRIGLLGLSMGGMMAFALASMEPRVAAAVAGVTPASAFTEPNHIPVAPQTFAGAITDTPFLMLMGRADPFYTEEEAEQLYNIIASPQKELEFYDADHRLPEEYAERSVEWFKTFLLD